MWSHLGPCGVCPDISTASADARGLDPDTATDTTQGGGVNTGTGPELPATRAPCCRPSARILAWVPTQHLDASWPVILPCPYPFAAPPALILACSFSC